MTVASFWGCFLPMYSSWNYPSQVNLRHINTPHLDPYWIFFLAALYMEYPKEIDALKYMLMNHPKHPGLITSSCHAASKHHHYNSNLSQALLNDSGQNCTSGLTFSYGITLNHLTRSWHTTTHPDEGFFLDQVMMSQFGHSPPSLVWKVKGQE